MCGLAPVRAFLALALLTSGARAAPVRQAAPHAALALGDLRLHAALRGQKANASTAVNGSGTQAAAAVGAAQAAARAGAAGNATVRAAAAPAGAPPASPAAGTAAAAGPAGAAVGHCGCALEDTCTCGGHLGYLECVARACFTGKCEGGCPALMDSFMGQCELVSNESPCGAEISMGCTGEEASCEGRFHQERNGVIGLTIDTEHLSDESYCGPWGKCQGELHVAVDVHNAEPGLVLECAVPKVEGADFHDRELWYTCSGDIKDAKGGCTLPMVEELAPEAKLDGRCWLQKGGDKVTKRAYFNVENHYNRDLEQIDAAKRSKTEAKDVLPSPAKSHAAITSLSLWLAPSVAMAVAGVQAL